MKTLLTKSNTFGEFSTKNKINLLQLAKRHN